VTKTWNQILIHVTSSNESQKHKCVDLSDYNKYLNQIWYRAQIPHSTRRNGHIHIIWKSKMAAAAILNFGKMTITPDSKISAPNFTWRCITAMRRWPRDQKSKPEVNSRDVSQMKVFSISASISVTITDIWTKFGTELKYYTINTPEWWNSHNLKIQDGGRRNLGFFGFIGYMKYKKMSVTPESGRDKISASNFTG